jgi:NitT/TauT family transport system permease protein
MLTKRLSQWQRSITIGFSIIFLIASYSYLSYKQHQKNPNDKTIPGWSQLKDGTVKIFEKNARTGYSWLLEDSKESARRLFFGLLYGFTGALFIGLLIGSFPLIEAGLSWPLSILSKLPPTAALALFFVLLGIGLNMFIGVIVTGVLPILALTISLAVKDVPKELIYKAMTLGASRTELLFCVVFRQILPKIIDAFRLQIGPALVYLIAAEYACADVGFGYRLRLQARLVNMDIVFPYLAILIIFGFLMDYLLRRIQDRVCAWYITERS